MWWIPAVAVGGFILKKVIEYNSGKVGEIEQRSIFEKNLIRLWNEVRSEKDKQVITVMGQPGSGKSSLIDIITEGKCVPRPIIGQQTDATDWSSSASVAMIGTGDNMLVIDTPGYDTEKHPVNVYAKLFPFENMDKIILSIKGKIQGADELIYRRIINSIANGRSIKLLIVRSFSDSLDDIERKEIKKDFEEHLNLREKSVDMVFLINRYNIGIEEVKRFIKM